MHAEEPVAVEALLQLSETHRGEVAVRIRLQVGVVVARHDETNLVDADKDLLAALLNGDALGLLRLHVQRHMLAHTGDSLGKALRFNRFHQVVDRAHLECVEGELAVRGHEHHRRRELEMLQRLGELQARGLGHVDVKEHHVNGIFLQLLNGLAHAGRLGHNLGLPQLIEQELEL